MTRAGREALIEFALDWGGDGDMVVHCWAGISRSTAAAFTALCAINPLGYEAVIAASLRQASPWPTRLKAMRRDATHTASSSKSLRGRLTCCST